MPLPILLRGNHLGEGGSFSFADDANCVALWRFENGALTSDSKGANTLTNHNATSDAADFKDGYGSADFEEGAPGYLEIGNGSLSANFPFLSGSGNTTN